MMTFYAAIGSCRICEENNMKVPYIQKLGKLHPVSVPEFLVWSILLWQVMTYEELEKEYETQMEEIDLDIPDFDKVLSLLVKRKLIVKGIGYTGVDALYCMLSDAFILPYRMSDVKRIWKTLKLIVKGKLGLRDAICASRSSTMTDDECRVMKLVEQTPLSTAEVIRCFERNIHDVSSPEKVIAGIYSDGESDQQHISNEEAPAACRNAVLKAVSNLYLNRKIMLELP